MKIERTKNATRNLIFGWISKIYQTLVPFLMRTVIIYFMGIQYLGLNSLFGSILQMLNLAELGVGSAMVYSMYKPIVEDDTETICALMRLYKTYYRIIGTVIAVIGIILTPFIPHLIKGNLPEELNVYVLYLLNLAATVLSYWVLAYKNSIFQAYQRIDITSKITLLTATVQYILQLFVIIVLKNYYFYVILLLLSQFVTNILTAVAADKMYPDYKPQGELDKKIVKSINKRIKDLFTAKLGGVIVTSADTVVISAFLGLSALAIYQNYYFILTSIMGFITIMFNACTAGIGNSVIVETKEKNFNDLKKFTFLIAWITGFCTCCFLCMYQPFMKIWVGEDLTLNFSAVICLCIYFVLCEINQLFNTYKDAAGIWHEDRFRPLITSLCNLALNLIMVQFWGIYGVILSTVFSMLFVGIPWLIHNLFTVLFDKKYLPGYLRKLLGYIIVIFISCCACYFICSLFNLGNWGMLIVSIIICCIVPNIIYYIAYRKTTEFRLCLQLIDKATKGKLQLEKKLS